MIMHTSYLEPRAGLTVTYLCSFSVSRKDVKVAPLRVLPIQASSLAMTSLQSSTDFFTPVIHHLGAAIPT